MSEKAEARTEIHLLVASRKRKRGSKPTSSAGHEIQDDAELAGFSLPWQGRVSTISAPLSKLGPALENAQGEVEAWLASLKPSLAHDFDLDQIQIGVGVSAEGSIAIASAGVQANLTLVYSRRRPAP